ncbi:MAG: phage late control D family protein [Peptococcaceae bacterium]|jgi:hypothetical protein|nr:phage late control D family protein [Peptococcaceae bacterium]
MSEFERNGALKSKPVQAAQSGPRIGSGIWVSPFAMLDVLDVDIHVSPNEHATANIRGTIDEKMEGAYLSLAQADVPASVTQTDDDGKPSVLFAGLVADMDVTNVNGLKVLNLKLVSSTRMMDVVEHTRTYQDASLTYQDLLSSLGYYPEYSFSLRAGEGAAIGDLITQFKETDWEFVKRLASHFSSVVIPDYISGGVGYYFGIPEKSSNTVVDPSHYRVLKGIGEYVNKTRNQVSGLMEGDALYYIVRDRAIYRMGEKVRFKNRDLRVFEIRSVLEGQVLQNYYTLKSDPGFKTRKTFNFGLVGASLGCTVTGVQKDMVQVHVHEDNDDFGAGTKWFAYSTVYSSPDGTGWYAMPEIGDELRLYFPSEHESQAYTISAVNVDSPDMGADRPPALAGHPSSPAPRTDPNIKTMINKELKEVSLYPDKIIMTNNNGMTIIVDDGQGIIIKSDKKVTFKSDEAITIASSADVLSLLGGSKVSIAVGGTKVELTNDIKFEGGSLYMQ